MRGVVKAVASGIAWLLAAPIAYPIVWLAPLDPRDQIFRTGSQAVSLIPGIPGILIRRHFYGITLDTTGEGLTIEFGTILSRRNAAIGNHVYIGAYCTLGLCAIFDDVLIGSGVDVVSGQRVHDFDRPDVPIRLQGGQLSRPTIGPDAWLGNKAVVMAAVGQGCVVGAGSVVTSACEPGGVYVGSPARRIKDRTAPPLTDGADDS